MFLGPSFVIAIHRLPVFAAAATAALLTGCVQVTPDTIATGGAAGLGGLASGGQSGGGGTGFGGQSGQSTGGVGGAGAGGQGTGGIAGGGAGGGGGAGSQAAGGSGGGTGIPPTFDTLKLVIEAGSTPACAASDCHGLNTENILELALDDRLHNTLLTHMSVACGNIPVVTPGDPTRSALIKLLKGPCGETPRMPRGCMVDEFGSTCIPDDYIAAIEEWVRLGAPP